MPTYETYLIVAAHAISFACMLLLTALPLLGILQQEGYSGRSTMRWFYKRGNILRRRYSLLTLALILVTALLPLCFSFAGVELSLLVATVGYAGICALFVYSFRFALKVPFKFTNRGRRLFAACFLLVAAIAFGLGMGMFFAAEAIGSRIAHALLRAVPPALLPLAMPALLVAANFCMKGYEVPHSRKFLKRAKGMLAESSCIKVGITGSFGKTSVKHFAKAILERKFRVIATPASFNTPLGIARCVSKGGLDCDIFLAEMGARQTGDIAELCDMVCPEYAVATGICAQHLETFGSIAAIAREKGVLARYAKRSVIGATASGLARENSLLEGRDFGADNIVCTPSGTQFTLHLGGEEIQVHTALLGRHAAEDIALAAALAFILGMTAEEIAAAIPAIQPVPHRLELWERNGLHILDDSYNSNVLGAHDAVETLKLFPGKKFVVTPGLVELGELEEKENASLGATFVGLDGVILVGETLILAVRQGYLDAGGDDKNLTVVPTLKKAQEVLSEKLSEGDAVLFLNDLPDKFL